jgi:hypothetical protein
LQNTGTEVQAARRTSQPHIDHSGNFSHYLSSTLAKATVQEENGTSTNQEGNEPVEFDFDKAMEDLERMNFEEQMAADCTCAEEFGLNDDHEMQHLGINCPYNY